MPRLIWVFAGRTCHFVGFWGGLYDQSLLNRVDPEKMVDLSSVIIEVWTFESLTQKPVHFDHMNLICCHDNETFNLQKLFKNHLRRSHKGAGWSWNLIEMFIKFASTKMLFELPHDKTNKVSVPPAKTQISLGVYPVWSESSLCAQWVAKDPSFLHVDSEDSDQTGQMPRLIRVFVGHTCHFFGFVMRWLILFCCCACAFVAMAT